MNALTNVGLWFSGPESYTCVLARTELTKITTHIGVLCCITPTLSIDKSRKQIRFGNPLLVFTNIYSSVTRLAGRMTGEK